MNASPPACTLLIRNQRGLHARAAARFVKCVTGFRSDVTVSRDGTSVSGHSIMGLMMLAASIGTTIDVRAEGPDAAEALAAITALVECGFEEGVVEDVSLSQQQ